MTFLYKEDAAQKIQVALFYNRRFKRPSRNLESWEGSYTASFHPDCSIAITVSEGALRQKHWFHFDAKYRMELAALAQLLTTDQGAIMEPDEDDDELGYEQEISRVHRKEDLFKMHTYRDGILSTRGAYILFPGDRTELRADGKKRNFFIRHPSAFVPPAAQNFPSVGAFDLCPGRSTDQLPAIKTFLHGVLQAVSAGITYQEEQGFFR